MLKFGMNTLQSLCPTTAAALASSKSPTSANNARKRRNRQLPATKPTTTATGSIYPPSRPTPVVLPPQAPTSAFAGAEALERVVADLESAVARGVSVADEPSLLASILEACSRLRSLRHGERVRRLIPPALLRRSAVLSSKLVRLYASCGRMDEAHDVFDRMTQRNKDYAFAWNSLISGYADLGMHEDAMALYYQMEEEGVRPDEYTFPRVLKACARIGSVRHGEEVHRHIVRSGFCYHIFVQNALIDMYSKCGDIQRARSIFDKMPVRDSVTWNSIITGFLRHGLLWDALDVAREMFQSGAEPDSITISAILSGLDSAHSCMKLGFEFHGWVLRRGLMSELSVANSLIAMYAEHNRLHCGQAIFECMPQKDLVSWNTIIAAHCRSHQVLLMFRRMENAEVKPDPITFVSLLSACANLGLLDDGRRLFSLMEKKYGITPGMEHYGCMVNLLGRAGLVDEAYELVSKHMPFAGGPTVWGALLYSCSLHAGNVSIAEIAAERLFELEPDNELNFELLVRTYRSAGMLEEVDRVRRLMRDRGLEPESYY